MKTRIIQMTIDSGNDRVGKLIVNRRELEHHKLPLLNGDVDEFFIWSIWYLYHISDFNIQPNARCISYQTETTL